MYAFKSHCVIGMNRTMKRLVIERVYCIVCSGCDCRMPNEQLMGSDPAPPLNHYTRSLLANALPLEQVIQIKYLDCIITSIT